jgi:hypothetical protein
MTLLATNSKEAEPHRGKRSYRGELLQRQKLRGGGDFTTLLVGAFEFSIAHNLC